MGKFSLLRRPASEKSTPIITGYRRAHPVLEGLRTRSGRKRAQASDRLLGRRDRAQAFFRSQDPRHVWVDEFA
jgi:hypothetical protein